MVKPERERMDPGHRLWHYREHAAEDNLDVQASSTCYMLCKADSSNR
jgi:chitin synthase